MNLVKILFPIWILFGATLCAFSQSTWSWQNPKPKKGKIKCVAWFSNQIVAVGENGLILTSKDGNEWNYRNSGTPINLNTIVSADSQLIVFGDSGIILTSGEGNVWTKSLTEGNVNIKSVLWKDNQYVGIDGGNVLTSHNGIKWAIRYSITNGSFKSITCNNKDIVAVGDSGTIAMSTDGTNWNKVIVEKGFMLNSIAWSGNDFVIVGKDGVILTSSDGTNWITQNSGTTSFLSMVMMGNKKIVAFGDAILLTSLDGVNWTRLNVPEFTPNTTVYSAVWTGIIYVAISSGGGALITTKEANWVVNYLTSAPLYSVKWLNNQFVAVGGGFVTTSPDGVTWTIKYSGKTDFVIYDVIWTVSQYFTVGGESYLSSPDGNIWTKETTGNLKWLSSVTWTGSTAVAVGHGTVQTSTDGNNWTQGEINSAYKFNSVIWNGNKLVAVGNYAAISEDGIKWTPNGIIWPTMYSITWSGDLFVAVGEQGAVYTSKDGVSWEKKDAGTLDKLTSVTWTGKYFIAINKGGSLFSSTDGVSWQKNIDTTGLDLNSIVWNGKILVAVGYEGKTLTSSLDGTIPVLNNLKPRSHFRIYFTKNELFFIPPSIFAGQNLKVSIYTFGGKKIAFNNRIWKNNWVHIPIGLLVKGAYILEVEGTEQKFSEVFKVE